METRHWLEAWIDCDQICSKIACEHPHNCTSTSVDTRHLGCTVIDFYDNIGEELINFPLGVKPLFGRVEVGVRWMGPAEDAYIDIVPIDPPVGLDDPNEFTFRVAERLVTDELRAVVLTSSQHNTDLDMCGARHAIMARNIAEDLIEYLLTQGWTPPGELTDTCTQDNGPPTAVTSDFPNEVRHA